MKTYDEVVLELNNWKTMGMTKSEIVIALAEACMGWPYVWGGYGQRCTKANRESYANRSTCPSAESDVIRAKCQQLRNSNPKNTCAGCRWYPGGSTLFFDCRGFTRWCLTKVGVTIAGAGATSQWNTASNWAEKGSIKDIPEKVCCVFMQSGTKMSHTGLYVGNGKIIHCSGEVKVGKITDRGWTHYAVPKGLDGSVIPDKGDDKVSLPTLRKGSRGEYVTLLQTKLIQQGYDLAPYGADGAYGNKTVEAVKTFQRDHGLSADGICGPKTWEAINSGVTTLYTVTIPHIGKTVADEIVGKYGGVMVAENT